MKRTIITLLFSIIVIIPVLLCMASPMKMTDAREKKGVIQIKTEPNLEIHEGYVSQKEETVLVKKGRKTIARIHLSKPVMVAMAEQEEKWGFFQFPSIGKTDSGDLNIEWQMAEDSHMSFGKKANRRYVPMVSEDGGNTWKQQERSNFVYRRNFNVCFSNGEILQVKNPPAKDIHSYKVFPEAVSRSGRYSYYVVDSLPKDLQGSYFTLITKDRNSTEIHAKLYDPGLLRYAIDDFMPVIWWGNIKQLADNSLIAGMHPTYYLDCKGSFSPSGVSFYKSKDKGKNWKIVGKIPWIEDKYNKRGYNEPAFELLKDSTLICIMRTGHDTPMYRTFSYDRGRTWTMPEPFTPNGVMPRLLLLKNGVLVLASGRPGIQVRFSLDGTGRTWTEPIEMIHFMRNKRSYIRDVSCGYASIIDDGDNSFYIVYSDFTTKDSSGSIRKSIWCRKITIDNYKE